jgi:PEP-CTERM motif
VTSNADSFVSQWAHGVLWERVIPEPATGFLAMFAALGMVVAGRTRKPS